MKSLLSEHKEQLHKVMQIFTLILIVGTLLNISAPDATATATESSDSADFYQIATAEDLVLFQQKVNSGDRAMNATLVSDIDLSDIEWTPIGFGGANHYGAEDMSYTGTFDGQGHKITGLTLTLDRAQNIYGDFIGEMKAIGLFGEIASGGIVKNLRIEGAKAAFEMTGSPFSLGTLAASNSGTIQNVTASGTLFSLHGEESGSGIVVGGLTGINNIGGLLENVETHKLDIQMDTAAYIGINIGGITAYNTGIVQFARARENKIIANYGSIYGSFGGIAARTGEGSSYYRGIKILSSSVIGGEIRLTGKEESGSSEIAIGGILGDGLWSTYSIHDSIVENTVLTADSIGYMHAYSGGIVGKMEIHDYYSNTPVLTGNMIRGERSRISASAKSGIVYIGGISGQFSDLATMSDNVVDGGTFSAEIEEDESQNAFVGIVSGHLAYEGFIYNTHYKREAFVGLPLVGYTENQNPVIQAFPYSATTPASELPALVFELDKEIIDLDGTAQLSVKSYPGTQGILSSYWYVNDPDIASVSSNGSSAVLTGIQPGKTTYVNAVVVHSGSLWTGVGNVALKGTVHVLSEGSSGGDGENPGTGSGGGSSGCSAFQLAGLSILLLPLFFLKKKRKD